MAKDGNEPKILVFDIETKPLKAYVWTPWQPTISPNQIVEDWAVMSWSAKWLDKDEIFYADNRKARDFCNDKKLLKNIWKLLNEADIVVTQNGKSFDEKKLNARFLYNDMGEPAPFLHADTKRMAKNRFGFTFNSLEYLAAFLKCKYKKLTNRKYPGMELWNECLKRNQDAWQEMERYNKRDILATEEVYKKLRAWGTPGINLNVYTRSHTFGCDKCGSPRLNSRGTIIRKNGKFKKFQCQDCGGWCQHSGEKNNLLSKEKRKSLKGK